MFKSISIDYPLHKVFAWSDLHVAHNRDFIFKKRGYSDIWTHDRGMIHGWNAVCDDTAIVFNLGDVVFNDSTGEKFLSLHRALNFKEVYLLIGNHTSGHRQTYLRELEKQFPNSMINGELQYEVYPLSFYLDGNINKKITFLPEYAEVSIRGFLPVVLCHYPIISHNKQGRGGIMLCGHSHSSCQITNKDTGSGRRLDVGVESFPSPISFLEIEKLLGKRNIDSRDHHDAPDRLDYKPQP